MHQKNAFFLKLAWTLPLISLVLLAACGGAVSRSIPDPIPDIATAPPEGADASPALITRPPTTMRFSHISLPEGLSQSAVNCILQDQQGFLWIGTQDGLNRFDGYSFKVYKPDPNDPNSISDRWINTLFQDSQGNLWIGTRQGGLNRYDFLTGNFFRYTHDANDYKSLVSNRVQEIYEDRLGILWIGTAQGLDQFAPAIGGFIHFKLTETTVAGIVNNNNILSMFEDSSGTLWIGTGGGLKSYNRPTNEFVAYPDNTENPLGLNGNSVHDIQENPDQNLWLATRKGLALFNPTDGTYTYYQHEAANPESIINNTVRTLYLDKAGVLWIGTNDGLDRLDPSTEKFIHYRNDPSLSFSLSSNVITAIFESADNILWIGTFGGGLNTYYRGQDRFTYYYNTTGNSNSFSSNMIYNVYVDATGIVWIGTLNGGLSALNPDTGEITRYLNDPNDPGSLMSNEVRTIYKDHNDTLWVGSTAGLDRLDPGSDTFIHYRPETLDSFHLAGASVNDILEDRHGNLWIATDFGLDLFNRQSLTFTHYRPKLGDTTSISGYEITTVFEDQGGTLWVGTFNDGLNRFTPRTGEFIRFQHDPRNPQSLSNNSILSIFEDNHGNLWIGTAGGGLNLYDPGEGTFSNYLESDGLSNNVVNGILQDEQGYLWISTNNGISRFDIETQTFRNFTASDGLQGNEFNMSACAKDQSGNLYFGGTNGLTVFNPTQVVDSTFTPPIVLLSFTKDGVPVDSVVTPNYTEEITIRWPWQYFEFEFAALSYAQPEENQYAYILENHDTTWHMIGTEHKGQYTNLPGGEYTLHLIGSNSDGIWNEIGHSVKIIVIPPFWETWAFRAAVAFAILALIYTAYRLRVKSVETYNRQLERQVSDRTLEIEQLFEKTKELVVVKERNRLARELHDSAKQKAFAALAQLGTANGILPRDPRSARVHLAEAENLVYQVIEELTFLIQEMYPAGLKDKGLATSLRDYIFEWESRNDIPAAVVIENEQHLPLEIEQAIYRVIQESLSNVARHSKATNVQVSLIYHPEMVESVIIDNGCGFDPQSKANGIGLRSIRERIESLGGTVEIESPQNCGTRVTIRVPLKSVED